MTPDHIWIARYMLRDGLTEGSVARILGVSIEAVLAVVPLVNKRTGKRISPGHGAARDRYNEQRKALRRARERPNQSDPAQGVQALQEM